MLLIHNNLVIRNATMEDSVILATWWNDGKIMEYAGFPNGLGTTPEKIATELKADSDRLGRRLIIEKDNIPIGEMSYRNKGDGIAEIGIKICDFSKQEKGYGKILLSMLIKELFHDGYNNIILDTNLNNLRSQHVYETLGFIKKQVNINCWKNQLGEEQSAIDYELRQEGFVDFT